MVKRGFEKSLFFFGIIVFLIIVNFGIISVNALDSGRECAEGITSGDSCNNLIDGCMCYQSTSSSYLYCTDISWDSKGFIWLTSPSPSKLATCSSSLSCATIEYSSECLLPESTCWYDNVADGGSGWKWTYNNQIFTETGTNACIDSIDNDCDEKKDGADLGCSVTNVCDNDNSCEPGLGEDCENCLSDCSCSSGQTCQDGTCIETPSPTDCPGSASNLLGQSCDSWTGGCSCYDPYAPDYPLFCGKFSGSSTYKWFPLDPYCGTKSPCSTIDFTHGTCTWNDAVCWYDNVVDGGQGWIWNYTNEVSPEEEGDACTDEYDNDCDTVTDECAVIVPSCEIISANWKNLAGTTITSANAGDTVRLNFETTTQCVGQKISFRIYEDDWIGDDIISGITSITFTSTSGYITWIANWTEDTEFLESNPPEYYFTANVSEDSMNSGILAVNPSTTSCPTGIASGTSCSEWTGYCYCGSYSFYCGNYSNQGWKWFSSAPTCGPTTECKMINYTHGTCDWEYAKCVYDYFDNGTAIGWIWRTPGELSESEIAGAACNDGYNNDCDLVTDECATGECISHSYKQCYSGDVYWYDSCDVREEKYEDCGTNSCVDGTCVTTSTCDLISAKWNTTTNANVGDLMKLSIIGNSGCVGKYITFKVYEDDTYPLSDTQVYTPGAITIGNTNNFTTWTVTWMDDGIGQGNPEYYFIATVSGTSETVKSNNLNINDYPPPENLYCGDGTCNNAETCLNCPGDCGACPEECTIISAGWNETNVLEGTPVKLNIGTVSCNDGETVSFVIKEDDTYIDDDVTTNPSNVQISSNSASGLWIAEYQEDDDGNPEYYFTASVSEDEMGSTNQLIVTSEASCTEFNYCSDALTEEECNVADDCGVGSDSVPDTISCGDEYFCGCFWNETSSNCDASWEGVYSSIPGEDGTSVGTCSYVEESGDDCSDGLLTRILVAIWEWADGNEITQYDPLGYSEDCADMENTVICPASVQVPFFGVYGFIIAALIITLIYIFYFPRKKKK